MRATLVIASRLPGMNEVIGSANTAVVSKSGKLARGIVWNREKRKFAHLVQLHALSQGFPRIEKPARFVITFRDRGRDPDNVIGGGMKILFDALVEARLIPGDSPRWVLSLDARWRKSAEPSVTLEVETE